eukprot:4010641-Pleurochrysis_carterae.AAC.1
MPDPSEKGRDKESRPDSSGCCWHRKSRPVPTLACSRRSTLVSFGRSIVPPDFPSPGSSTK